MATTLVTLTGDVTDAIAVDFDTRRTKAYVRYNTPAVVTDDGPIHLGGGTVNVESDGTFSLENVVASTSLVENLQATVYIDYSDPTTRQRVTATFGPYDLSAETGTVDISDLEAVQHLDPSFASETIATMQALLDEMEVISGLTGEDDAVALLIDTPSSDTAVALSTAIDETAAANAGDTGTEFGAALAAADGAVMDRSTKTTFYDNFTSKADTFIASGGSYTSQSGHTVYVTGQLGLTVASGRGTSVRTNTATVQSTYLTADLGIDLDDVTGDVYADIEVPAGADPIQAFGLIIPEGTFGPPDFTDCATHCIFSPAAFHNSSLEALGAGAFTSTTLGRGQYTTLPAGTYQVRVSLDGRNAAVVDPYGKTHPCEASDFNVTRNNGHVTIQWYADVGTFKAYKVLGWGAELQRRAKRGPYASAAALGKVATQPGKVIAAMQSTGANVATALTTSLSAKLLGLYIPIPVSRRILIEGKLWFDESVAVTRTASALLVGAYLGGGTTYGRLSTIFSGYTPANATPSVLTGSKTHDWASIADGAMASTTVTVTGAILGGVASASMSVALPAGMQLTAAVTAADTVTVTLTNHSGSTQDLASGTLAARATVAQTSYAVGRLYPFALDLTIDPAFTIGDLIEVQIKAQASASSLFTFIDSGDASGGTSTLRRSTLKITELAPA